MKLYTVKLGIPFGDNSDNNITNNWDISPTRGLDTETILTTERKDSSFACKYRFPCWTCDESIPKSQAGRNGSQGADEFISRENKPRLEGWRGGHILSLFLDV